MNILGYFVVCFCPDSISIFILFIVVFLMKIYYECRVVPCRTDGRFKTFRPLENRKMRAPAIPDSGKASRTGLITYW